jgi:hypothetical protein
MAKSYFFLISILVYIICLNYHTNADENEYMLYQILMKNYTRLERPVANNSHPVLVQLGLILQQIVGVDEKNQIIEVNAWIKYTWNDYKLRWNPADFGGVSDVCSSIIYCNGVIAAISRGHALETRCAGLQFS